MCVSPVMLYAEGAKGRNLTVISGQVRAYIGMYTGHEAENAVTQQASLYSLVSCFAEILALTHVLKEGTCVQQAAQSHW